MKQVHLLLALLILTWLSGSAAGSIALAAEPGNHVTVNRIPNIRFRTLNVREGLPSDGVRALMQDSYGFVWMGTDNGICRYDGRSFHIPEHGGDLSVGVLSMVQADSAIWLGTDRGIFRYDPLTDSTVPVTLRSQNGISLSATVSSLCVDREGTIWAATYGQGIFAIVPRDPHLFASTQIPASHVAQYYIEGDGGNIAQVLVDSDNRVWAISNWHQPVGIALFNRQTQRFETVNLQNETDGRPLGSPSGLAIMQDRLGQMWIGSNSQGLIRFDRNTLVATQVVDPSVSGMQHIHSLLEYAPGVILVGSDDGLLAVDVVSGTHRLFTENQSDPAALSNRFVYPLMLDAEGSLWVGTYYGGVSYASSRVGAFESISGHVISRFCEDDKGRIWIASDDAGLLCLDHKPQGFSISKPYNLSATLPRQSGDVKSYSNLNCHALCAKGRQLWVGTYSTGIVRLNLDNGQTHHYASLRDQKGEPLASSCYALYTDQQGQMWVGTSDGVCLYDSIHDCFKQVRRLKDIVIDIDQEQDGTMWFCTQGSGVWRYNSATDTWKEYGYQGSNLPRSNTVNCLQISKDGSIWMGSNDGLCRYDAEREEFTQVLPGIVRSIVGDRHLLWITMSDGLICYDTTGTMPTQYYSEDESMVTTNYMPNAAFMARDGRIYLGAARGLNTFLPYRLQPNSIPPRVVLTELEIFNQTVPVGGGLLDRQLALSDKLVLSHTQNSFAVHFASLSYVTPRRNRYSYRLEGFDKEWINVNSPVAAYTNVPPGDYVLHVRGSNNDGIWSKEETLLRISVRPPFYWNLPARIIYALLFVALLAAVIWWLLHRGERRHAEELRQMAARNEQQMHEARMKFFTTIAHEIRTPVSLIIGPMEQILRQADQLPTTVRTHLSVVSRNSQRLLDLVNQLLDFRKVEQGTTGYHYRLQPIEPIIRSVVERFVPFVSQQGAVIESHFSTAEVWAAVDREAITKLVSNLMMNAAKYTRSKIWIELMEDSSLQQLPEPSFVIIVRDDGLGMTDEVRRRVFEPFYQANDNKPGTGIGLAIVKNIIDMHHGHIDVKSQSGVGTQFVVTIPLHRDDEEEVEAAGSFAQTADTEARDESMPVAAASADLSNSTEQPSVLIVDDNEELLSFLGSCMTDQYEVLTATSGEEALALLRERQVTLIISDWMMPGMDGGELCRALRRNPLTSHIPIILLTAKTDNASKVAGMDCGADTYIEKPFSVDYVLACARNLLDLRRMLRASFASRPLTPVTTVASNPTDTNFVQRITELIEHNFDNPDLSIEFLAHELCMSRSGLFAKIKALTDTTPGEMIQLTRLKKAAQLLSEGNMRISEICYQVGFSSPSYFTKCFTAQFGVKPSEFAAQMNKSNLS